jgi:hypothetical protein
MQGTGTARDGVTMVFCLMSAGSKAYRETGEFTPDQKRQIREARYYGPVVVEDDEGKVVARFEAFTIEDIEGGKGC